MKITESKYGKRLKTNLMRHPTKRHFMGIFKIQKPKRHLSETMYDEERKPPVTMPRIFVGIIILHCIFIAGYFIHREMTEKITPNAESAEIRQLTQVAQAAQAKPIKKLTANPQDPIAQEVPKNETQMISVTIDNSAIPLASNNKNMLPPAGSAPQLNNAPKQIFISSVPTTIDADAQKKATPASRVAAASRHHILSGETWHSIAKKHQISQDLLKKANPQSAARSTIYAGDYLAIPGSDGKAPQEAINKSTSTANYSIVSGDTLAAIARKHKMSTAKLMKINNLTNKDARRIRPGQILIIRH